MSSQSSLSDRFKRPSQSIQSRPNHSMFNGHHATVDCPECHRIMVPRVITYYGQPTKSICPFCGATFAKYPSGLERLLARFQTRVLTFAIFKGFVLVAILFGLTFLGSSNDILPESLSEFSLFMTVVFTAVALAEFIFQCVEKMATRFSHESNYYWALLVLVAWASASLNRDLTLPIIILSFAMILRGILVGLAQVIRKN